MTIKAKHIEKGCIKESTQKESTQYNISKIKPWNYWMYNTKLRTKYVLYISSQNIQSGNVAQEVICYGIAIRSVELKIQTENISTNTNHDSEYIGDAQRNNGWII